MSNVYLKNITRFFFLILLQVLILDKINFGGYINPYLYIYFILLLPFEIPGWLLLFSSFLIGMGIDLFSGTLGIHSASSVLIAFFRPKIIKTIASKKEYEVGMQPSIRDLGFKWFFTYALFLILIHHFVLFYLEVFRFSGFFITLQRVLYSSFFTLVLVILTQ
ncbi:MAG: rod shape-determining protein MreD, partial [Bacteroidales bacterium]|nr:rod shape-determining protein MreD [Bacteroidales bacterium]